MRRVILTLTFALFAVGVALAQSGAHEVSKSTTKNFDKGVEFFNKERYDKALKYLYKAAVNGHAEAQLYMGGCYNDGLGIPKSAYEAVQWWLKAAELGQADAQYFLACAYFNGEGAQKSDSEALKWLGRSAEAGCAEAQCQLAQCYLEGIGVEVDDAAAVKALSDAYGEPTGLVLDRTDLLYWVSVDPAKAADEKVLKKCEDAGVRLSYLGLAEPLPAWLLQPYVCFNLVGGSWRIEDMDTDGVGYRLSFTALNYVKTLHL